MYRHRHVSAISVPVLHYITGDFVTKMYRLHDVVHALVSNLENTTIQEKTVGNGRVT